MVRHASLLVALVRLIDVIPLPAPGPRRRGRPSVYSDRLFLKALVIMIVRHLSTVHALLAVLEHPTPEMQQLRALLTEDSRYPSRRTFERRLHALLRTSPAQIACLGRHLVALIQPYAHCGRAAALDSTILRARDGVWHKKDRDHSEVPHTSIATEAHWTKSGWHGWVYGWKLHLAAVVATVWIPLAATLTPANRADNEEAPALIRDLPPEVRDVLGDVHYNDPGLRPLCEQLLTSQARPEAGRVHTAVDDVPGNAVPGVIGRILRDAEKSGRAAKANQAVDASVRSLPQRREKSWLAEELAGQEGDRAADRRLMAVDDVGPRQRQQEAQGDRAVFLAVQQPGRIDLDLQLAERERASGRAEADELGAHLLRHGARQLDRVSLRAPHDRFLAEVHRRHMDDLHGAEGALPVIFIASLVCTTVPSLLSTFRPAE